MNIEQARINMLKQQVRAWGVTDTVILEVLNKITREDFAPADQREFVFADTSLPIGHGQFMLSPATEGKMLQAAAPKPSETVLEIGTGTGYFTALLATLAKHVTSVDIYDDFCHSASSRLQSLNIHNVDIQTGDASRGWESNTSFDLIVITGALPFLPDSFKRLLNKGGRVIAILGDSPAMEVVKVERQPNGELLTESLFETDTPYLNNAVQPERFTF